MTTSKERQQALADILEQRVLVLDGAMGTMLQQRNLTAADFGGPVLEGCNESLNRTRPDVVLAIHRAYLAAGSDAIETNSFNCDAISLHDYGLQNDVGELNITAAKLARQAADEFWTAEKPRFVIGSMGPTTKSITVMGGVTFPNWWTNLLTPGRLQARCWTAAADLLLRPRRATTHAPSRRRW